MSVEEFEAFVSRATNSSSYVNTLRPGLEHRLIAWLQGKQFHNEDMPAITRIPDILLVPGPQRPPQRGVVAMRNQQALPIIDHGNGVHTLVNAEQGVHYTLMVRQKKSELEEYMRLENTYLVYAGHARFGRGACFGTGVGPSEEWEDGDPSDTANTGLFRMGFPYIPIPRLEIIEHGYTANAVTADTPIAREDCHPDLVANLRKLKPRTAAQIDPELVGRFKDPDPDRTYWTYNDYDLGKPEIFVLLHAGWQATSTHPHELNEVDLKCRVFCDFGCSTQKHHSPVLRGFKGWQREGDERYAFFTTHVANNIGNVYWLYHTFTYDQWSAFEPWEAGLKYTLQRTNRDLGRDGWPYRYI